MTLQRTLARAHAVAGIGLRSGQPTSVTLLPAPVNSGRRFIVGGVVIPAHVQNVVDATLATTLGVGTARVALVEHLLAATVGAGVDNLDVVVEGDELPILDGAALGWVGALAMAGISTQDAPVRTWPVPRVVRVEQGEAWAELHPCEALEVDVRVDFPHPSVGSQRWSGLVDGSFASELGWARTFGFRKDAERLLALGIARGASLANTVVFDEQGPMNAGGTRAGDEVARHKALDAVGDLALVPGRARVRLVAYRGGHALHHALLRALA